MKRTWLRLIVSLTPLLLVTFMAAGGADAQSSDWEQWAQDVDQRYRAEYAGTAAKIESAFGSLLNPTPSPTTEDVKAAAPASLPEVLTAIAVSASAQEPQFSTIDDPKDVTGPLDLKHVRHASDATTIYYEATMWADLEITDLTELGWLLDFDSDPNTDACVATRYDGSKLKGFVFGEGCSGASFAEATVTKKDAATFRVTIPISAIQGAGFSGNTYRYKVQSNFGRSIASINTDNVPDSGSITHELGKVIPPGTVLSPLTGQPAAAGTTASPQPAAGSAGRAAPGGKSGLPSNGAPIASQLFVGAFLLLTGTSFVGAEKWSTRRARTAVWPAVWPEVAPARMWMPAALPAARGMLALPAPRVVLALPAPRVVLALAAPLVQAALPSGRREPVWDCPPLLLAAAG